MTKKLILLTLFVLSACSTKQDQTKMQSMDMQQNQEQKAPCDGSCCPRCPAGK